MKDVVGARGFEPPTYGTQNRRATRLRYAPTMRLLTDHIGGGKSLTTLPCGLGLIQHRIGHRLPGRETQTVGFASPDLQDGQP